MRLLQYILTALLAASASASISARSPNQDTANFLEQREAETGADVPSAPLTVRFDEELLNHLEKRRGGGGSGGGGGRASGSSGSGSGGGAGGSGSRNTGTASSSSGVSPSYGGGRYYGGGATSSYRAGSRTPLGGILPFALVGGALGAAAIFPGLWLYGAYSYNYNNPYSFRNRTNSTANAANRNDTLPVTCLCEMYSACGCDDNGNSTFLDGLVGDGNYDNLNKTLINVSNVNGTRTLVLNGTLPNGTDTSASAAASSAAPSATSTSAAIRQSVVQNSGVWAVGGIVAAMVWSL